nr:protein trichome birefringence-like 2 [Ipomoea batatas]
MELKKHAFSGQFSPHAFLPRRKFSGCWRLSAAAAFFMVGVAVLNFSFNGSGYRNATVCCSPEEIFSGEENFSGEEKDGAFGVREGIWKKTQELNRSENGKNVNFTGFTEEKGDGIIGSGKNGSFSLEGETVKSEGSENGDRSRAVGVEIGKKGSSVTVKNDVIGENGSELLRKGRSFYSDCDIFDGEWVRDDTKPYYPPGSCPFIDRDFDCQLHKRPDDAYVKWRWRPHGCDIPSFNATDFLERLRGQKLVFVGDSLNRNMWESLVCILRHRVRDKKRVFEISGRSDFKKKGFYAFRFEDYNCSVDFVSSPFLVRESSFKGVNGSFETLRLDLMDTTTSMYNDADIIIFNTGHWWTHEKTSRGEDYYQEGNRVHPRLEVLEAYKRALHTWARWVDKNINPNRTHVIFRGYSVTHFRGGPWNSGGQCHNETEPFLNEKHLEKYPPKMEVLEHVLHDMRTPVAYMNISRLTDYRKDGHPSIYRVYSKSSLQAQDCSHWCLPGVPDTWNELLYASLLKNGRGSWQSSYAPNFAL